MRDVSHTSRPGAGIPDTCSGWAECPDLDVATILDGPGETELGREADWGKLRDSPENSPRSGEQAEVLGRERSGQGRRWLVRDPRSRFLPGFGTKCKINSSRNKQATSGNKGPGSLFECNSRARFPSL